MKHLNVKNKNIRFFTKKTEIKTFIYHAIQHNLSFGQLTVLKAHSIWLLTILRAPFYTTAFTNRCVLSNRKKRINKILNVSRLILLEFARFGELCGITKAVW